MEIKAAKSQIKTVVQEFEKKLRTAGADQFNLLLKKSESAIASIVEAHCPTNILSVRETNGIPYTPKLGEKIRVTGLGNKLATVVEAPGDDDTVLVQYGKIRARVNISSTRALPVSDSNAAIHSVPSMKKQVCRLFIIIIVVVYINISILDSHVYSLKKKEKRKMIDGLVVNHKSRLLRFDSSVQLLQRLQGENKHFKYISHMTLLQLAVEMGARVI